MKKSVFVFNNSGNLENFCKFCKSCFWLIFSHYFEKNEYKYYNYRNHIYRYAKVNFDKIKENFEYEYENGEKIYYIHDEITTHSKIPLLQYINNIKLNKQYAGDLELSCASSIYNTVADLPPKSIKAKKIRRRRDKRLLDYYLF